MTIVGLPLILFRAGKGRKLSDIEFLAIKKHGGKLRSNESQRTTVGDVATLTANTGKDMYLGRAKIKAVNGSAGAVCSFEIKLNGVAIESCLLSSDVVNGSDEYEFKNIGGKVAAGEIIKLEFTSEAGTCIVEGFIECWEEATGATPQIPSI